VAREQEVARDDRTDVSGAAGDEQPHAYGRGDPIDAMPAGGITDLQSPRSCHERVE
jgi:hypothetical protein